jgi:hypothetical protein
MRRRLLLLAIPVIGALGFVAPHANAGGSVCVNAHVEANGTTLVDQAPCVTIPDAPAPPALP